MRLVLDTNVVASAMLWGDDPRRFLTAAQLQRIRLFTSAPLLLEITDILARRKFAAKIEASGLSIDQLVAGYAQLTTVVRPVDVSGVAPDPDDDVVVGTALAAHADAIVTGDKPLLGLTVYQGVRIISVSAALPLIDSTAVG